MCREDIPDVPLDRIAYIDGYGNLKTTIKYRHDMRTGGTIGVRVGEVEREAIPSDGSFAVEQGKLAFAPGSSGWTAAGGEAARWMELFLRGGNAWEAFGRPAVGAHVYI